MSSIQTSRTEPYVIPADILAKLEQAPDRFSKQKEQLVRAAIKQFWPQKSMTSIADACGCSCDYVSKQIRFMGLEEE